MAANKILISVILFIAAGLCEIGDGWLMWQWLREGQKFSWAIVGALVLILYGVIPTFQPSHFCRVYAVYGGFFIILSLIWGGWWTGTLRIDLICSGVR